MRRNFKYIIAFCIVILVGFATYKIVTAKSATEIAERSLKQTQEKWLQDIREHRSDFNYYSMIITSDYYTLTEQIDAYHKLKDLIPEFRTLSFHEVKKRLMPEQK